MNSKEKRLCNCSLYLILDAQVLSYDLLLDKALQAAKAGVTVFQLRDKKASNREIVEFSKQFLSAIESQVIYIINDRVDLVKPAGASGVHLGQADGSLKAARELLGSDYLIGTSCQKIDQISQAKVDGADYIGFGSVFKTLTKPDRQPMELQVLKLAVENARQLQMPLFAIGGIDLHNVEELSPMGVQQIAVCRAVLESKYIAETIHNFFQILTKNQVAI